MQLFVRGLDGRSTCVLVGARDSVLDLKQRLEATHGIPVAEQLLTSLGGRPLPADPATPLGSPACAGLIAHGACLQLLLRLAGGKGGFGALLRGQGRDGKITDNFDAMRDLSGRRVRQVEAEKKLKQWEAESKERELEALALKHMKELARQARRERDVQINVEEVKREHKEAAERVAEAVHSALAEGLHKQQQHGAKATSSSGSDGSGGSGSVAAAAAAAAGGSGGGTKRKQDAVAAAGGAGSSRAAAAAAAGGGGSPPKKRKPTMLDLVNNGSDDDEDSSSDEE